MSAPKSSQSTAIRELLPWYATGAVSRQEARSVEQALAEDVELARDFERVREEMAETIQRNEMLGAPSAAMFERLMAVIGAEPASRNAGPSLGARWSGFVSSLSGRKLRWAATAAAAVLVIQAGVIAELVSDRTGETTPSVRGIDLTRHTYILVSFQDNATAGEIGRFLQENRLTVVGGPVDGSSYQVKLADAQLPNDEVARRIRALQQSPIIGAIVPLSLP